MAEEVTSEWNRSSTYAENRRFSPGEKNGEKIPEQQGEKEVRRTEAEGTGCGGAEKLVS